jgi:hypothetical protein
MRVAIGIIALCLVGQVAAGLNKNHRRNKFKIMKNVIQNQFENIEGAETAVPEGRLTYLRSASTCSGPELVGTSDVVPQPSQGKCLVTGPVITPGGENLYEEFEVEGVYTYRALQKSGAIVTNWRCSFTAGGARWEYSAKVQSASALRKPKANFTISNYSPPRALTLPRFESEFQFTVRNLDIPSFVCKRVNSEGGDFTFEELIGVGGGRLVFKKGILNPLLGDITVSQNKQGAYWLKGTFLTSGSDSEFKPISHNFEFQGVCSRKAHLVAEGATNKELNCAQFMDELTSEGGPALVFQSTSSKFFPEDGDSIDTTVQVVISEGAEVATENQEQLNDEQRFWTVQVLQIKPSTKDFGSYVYGRVAGSAGTESLVESIKEAVGDSTIVPKVKNTKVHKKRNRRRKKNDRKGKNVIP